MAVIHVVWLVHCTDAQAIIKYGMIEDGDRVMVCLSGGKDSLSLLHSMRQYQHYAAKKGISFSLGAVTIDPQTPSYDPSPLKDYLKLLDTPYFYEEQCKCARPCGSCYCVIHADTA